jgi:hypothetical protein
MSETILSAASSIVLLALSLYILTGRRTAANASLGLASLLLALIEAGDGLALISYYDPMTLKRAVVVLESLLPAAFIVFGLTYAGGRTDRLRHLHWQIVIAGAASLPFVAAFHRPVELFYAPDIRTERMLFLSPTGYWLYMAITASCVLSLTRVEAAYAQSEGESRRRMTYEVIGISAMHAVLIFYFSQGLLYRTMDMNLLPVRSGVFVMSALLLGYSKALRGNGVKIVVSRYILYRSLTLVSVGLYLLILGIAGEGMRYLGVSFGRDLTIFIAFAAGMSMALALASEHLRRKVKVCINKHFFASKHDYRTEWLEFTKRLSACRGSSDVYDVVLGTCRETFGLEGAAIFMQDRRSGRYVLAASQAMPGCPKEIPVSAGLISYFSASGRVFNPGDGEYAPLADESGFVETAGARLIVPFGVNGGVDGLVVLGRQLAREDFTYEDYDLMKALAKQAALSAANFTLSEELADTREIAAVARISSFVIHDLKNLASALSAMLSNAEDFIGEPEFQKDMVGTIRGTVGKMNALMQRLKALPEKTVLNLEAADLRAVAGEAVREAAGIGNGATFRLRGEPASSGAVDVEEVRSVVLNLLLNASDAAGDGAVEVETGHSGGMAYVRVSDDGCGMEEEFIRKHLFRPFMTTKEKGLGIGLYQCKQVVEAHGGRIEVRSEAGKGSEFTVYLPSSGGL